MLVLQRKVGTSVEIQGGIKITILELCNGGVRMGIDAPSSVKILRTELIDNPQIELGLDRTLDCGSLGQINPNPIATGLATGIDSKRKNHRYED